MVQLMPPRHVLTPVAEALDRALALPDESVPDRERDIIGPLTSDAQWTGGQVSRSQGRPVHRAAGWGGLLLGPAAGPGGTRGARDQPRRVASCRSRLRANPTPIAAMTACIDACTAGLASLGNGRSTSTPELDGQSGPRAAVAQVIGALDPRALLRRSGAWV